MYDFHCGKPDEYTYRVRRLFVELVNLALFSSLLKSPLQRFTLSFFYTDPEDYKCYVNSWVRFAISCKVVELNLSFPRYGHPDLDDDESAGDETYEGYHNGDVYYPFQISHLINSRVEVLNLSSCEVWIPDGLSSVKLDSIREMLLMSVIIEEESDIELLIASCVNLEVLSLEKEFNVERLKIVSPKLKHFKLHCLGDAVPAKSFSLEMHAPSLESIDFCFVHPGKHVFKDATSLTVARLNFPGRNWSDFICWSNVLSIISGVEILTIQNMWTWFMGESTAKNSNWKRRPKGSSHTLSLEQGTSFHVEAKLGEAVLSETFVFHQLKHLVLLTDYLNDDLLGLEVLLNKCPHLVTLVLVYKYRSQLNEPLETVIRDRAFALHIPHLQLVKMKGYRGTRNEIYVVRLLKQHAFVLEKIVAYPAGLLFFCDLIFRLDAPPPSVL